MSAVRRALVSSAVGVLVVSAASFGVVSAQAADGSYDPRHECTYRGYGMWAANCDGWHVDIDNNSSNDGQILESDGSTGSTGLVSRDGGAQTSFILRKGDATTLLGAESWVGGPQDVTISYIDEGFPQARPVQQVQWARCVRVSSNIFGGMSVTCGVSKSVKGSVTEEHISSQENAYGCVTEANPKPYQPVEVIFTDLLPHQIPWTH